MRWPSLIIFMALAPVACSKRNMLGEEVWSSEELSRTEVGFGWNYETKGTTTSARNIDVLVKPDNSYEIRISAYQLGNDPKLLNSSKGRLDSGKAAQIRRSLDQLRSKMGLDLYATLPNCPETQPPKIQFYVGFRVAKRPAVTVIERNCDTPETVEGRKIVSDALRAFPQIDLAGLSAGKTNL